MRLLFLINFLCLAFATVFAQNNSASVRSSENTARTNSASSQTTVSSQSTITSSEPTSASIPPPPGYTNTLVIDYKSVYEAPTAEEEVKIAAERFSLTPDQQDIWLLAAKDRREGERQFNEKYNSNASNFEKDGAYRGYRTSQNTFYETIVGHLTPSQKGSFERDRLIIEERDKRLARWPMERAVATPSPQTTTVTVVPTTIGQDSTVVKEETKSTNKKATKKKKG